MDKNLIALLLLAGAFLSGHAAGGESVTLLITEPAADRWMYPANATPGFRGQASTFSALPSSGGDKDRFGQFVFRFDTVAAGIPAGRGADGYAISSLEVTARIAQNNLFVHDPTADAWFTYGTNTLPDEDLGRPLELHGTGFRNGFTSITFAENTAFSAGSPATRNAHALGFDAAGVPQDVGDNVTDAFDPIPWATGQITGVLPAAPVPIDSIVRFRVDLNLPGVRDYVMRGLDEGAVWFTLSSLHPALQQAGEFVSYYTRDSPEHQLFNDSAPTLAINYSLTAVAAPAFTTFGRSVAGQVSLTFSGEPGFVYKLQTSTALTTNSWADVETFTTHAPITFAWQGFTTHPALFFRIARTPAP